MKEREHVQMRENKVTDFSTPGSEWDRLSAEIRRACPPSQAFSENSHARRIELPVISSKSSIGDMVG